MGALTRGRACSLQIEQLIVYTHAVPLFGGLITTKHQAGSTRVGA